MIRIFIAAALLFALSSCAEAHHGRHHHHRHHHHSAQSDGRPHAWCGYWMRQQVGGDPGPAYNLAIKWAAWGRAAMGPAPGVIGVQAHHVFRVVQDLGRGMVLAISGNDGGAVRTRVRSTRNVIAWRSS